MDEDWWKEYDSGWVWFKGDWEKPGKPDPRESNPLKYWFQDRYYHGGYHFIFWLIFSAYMFVSFVAAVYFAGYGLLTIPIGLGALIFSVLFTYYGA